MKKGLLIAALGLSVVACGAEDSGEPAKKTDTDALKAKLDASFGRVEVTGVSPSPVEDVYTVELGGRELVYATADGKHVFAGKLLELGEGQPVNLTDQHYVTVRQDGIAKLDSANLITYQAEDQKAEIYAFTDITCGYCRKLHRHIDEYTEAGITVHYLAFPRGGESRPSAQAMRHIWCADDRQQALTDAKINNKVPENEVGACGDPVAEQYQLGLKFGVAGTPAIYTVEGKQLGGYVTPDQLVKRLDL